MNNDLKRIWDKYLKNKEFVNDDKSTIVFKGEYCRGFPIYHCKHILYSCFHRCENCIIYPTWVRHYNNSRRIDIKHYDGELFPDMYVFDKFKIIIEEKLKFFTYKDLNNYNTDMVKNIIFNMRIKYKIPNELIFMILSFIRIIDLGNEIDFFNLKTIKK